MRLFIVDPGQISRIGHHYEFNLSLTRHCRARSIETVVLANAACDEDIAREIGAVRIFSAPPYIHYKAPQEFTPLLRWMQLSESIDKELDRLKFPAFAPDDVLLMHTAHGGHINGLYRWYMRLPEPRPGVCLQVMFPPSFQVAPEDAEVATVLLKRALVPWCSVEGATIASDNGRLAAHLGVLLGHPVATLPMPIDFAGEAPGEAPSHRDRLRVAYLGEARQEKGFPQLAELLLRQDGRLEGMAFTLHTGHAGPLSAALRGVPDVEVLDRPLSQPEYAGLLRDCDAILLPYEAGAYAMRSSRVFAEALAMGKPVLVTAGTWMAEELGRWGTPGLRMDGNAPDAILAGLRELAARFPELRAAARQTAPAFRSENSPASFLGALSRTTGRSGGRAA